MYRTAPIDAPLEPASRRNHLWMKWVWTGQGLRCFWVYSPTAADPIRPAHSAASSLSRPITVRTAA
jgi:hypothetical protein